MSRRRYLSTKISTDTRVNRLALEYGDFAALLYSWAIPHAADDASLPDNPEELLFTLFPGRRDKTQEDVRLAVDGAVSLGLLIRQNGKLYFPSSFYAYQTYIKSRAPQNSAVPETIAEPAANQRKSAQISAEPRKKSLPLDSCLDSSMPHVRAHEEQASETEAAPRLPDYRSLLLANQCTEQEIDMAEATAELRPNAPPAAEAERRAKYLLTIIQSHRAKQQRNGAEPKPERKKYVRFSSEPGSAPLGPTFEESRKTP